MTSGRTTGRSSSTKEKIPMQNDMNRQALRQTLTDKMNLAAVAFQAILVTLWFLAGVPVTGAVWAGIFLAVDAIIGYSAYRWSLSRLRDRAELARDRHEHDLRMERIAQEHDILLADHDRRAESIRETGTDPGPSPRAAAIQATREAERAAQDAAEREARQARIAAFEAEGLTQNAVRLTG